MIKPLGYRQFRVVKRVYKGYEDYAVSHRDKLFPLPFCWGAWYHDQTFWLQEEAEKYAARLSRSYNTKPEKPRKTTTGIW